MSAPTLTGPVPHGWPAWGVDLNEHNAMRERDFQFLASNGCALVVARAANGTVLDARFHDFAGAAIRHHFDLGAYLYLNPAGVEPIRAQVEAFAAIVKSVPAPVRVVVDIENGKGRPPWTAGDQPARCLRQALWMLRSLFPQQRAMFYTYLWFYKTWLAKAPELGTYPLWAARFDKTLTIADVEAQFGRRIAMWQYGGGPVDGRAGSPRISKNVMLSSGLWATGVSGGTV